MIHVFDIIAIFLSFFLFEYIEFKKSANDFMLLIRKFQITLYEKYDDRIQSKKLIALSIAQFKILIILFLKLLIINLPIIIIILVFSYFTNTWFPDFLQWSMVFDCFMAMVLFYFFKKYVQS